MFFNKFERIKNKGGRKRLHCNSCERVTIHAREGSFRGTWNYIEENMSGGQEFYTYRCGACDTVCFEVETWDTETYFQNHEGEIELDYEYVQYPTPVSRDFKFDKDYTPDKLNALLDDTLHSFGGGRNILATVGLRMVIEFLTKDASCKGRDLKLKIDDLLAKSLIDQDQLDLLHKIRIKGNASAHEATPMSQKELIAGMEVASLLLEKLYNSPGRHKHTVTRAKKVLT